MQYYPRKNKGFAIDHDLAEELNILDQLLVWEEEFNELPFFEAFEEKFGFEPDNIQQFRYEQESHIQGLQGFEYDLTYVLFDGAVEAFYPEEWENMNNYLEENDIDIIEGSWAEPQ